MSEKGNIMIKVGGGQGIFLREAKKEKGGQLEEALSKRAPVKPSVTRGAGAGRR